MIDDKLNGYKGYKRKYLCYIYFKGNKFLMFFLKFIKIVMSFEYCVQNNVK